MDASVAQEESVAAVNATTPPDEITDWDRATYRKLVSIELTPAQRRRIENPEHIFADQEEVLAVHWHPEFVPLESIRRRVDAMFPRRASELIIPTQHNMLMEYDGYAGVEVDCFSRGFNRKVQLLLHFEAPRVQQADALRSMLAHTFNYRSRQLFEFIDTIVEPSFEDRLQRAARRAGADQALVAFVRLHTTKLQRLFAEFESSTPPEMVRNKLLSNYIDCLQDRFDKHLISHARTLLREIKRIVKANFCNDYFYATQEVIEEVRALGGGIVIPHPEQFWPILLAEYDVDGYEVWNPQSQEYTRFLIDVVTRQNKWRGRDRERLLILMGDDCHMGEKTKDPRFQDAKKAAREIGVQPAWDELSIRKSLSLGSTNRKKIIDEYKERLGA